MSGFGRPVDYIILLRHTVGISKLHRQPTHLMSTLFPLFQGIELVKKRAFLWKEIFQKYCLIFEKDDVEEMRTKTCLDP